MTLGKQVRLFERRNMAHSKWWDTPKRSANLGCLFRGRRQGRQPLYIYIYIHHGQFSQSSRDFKWSKVPSPGFARPPWRVCPTTGYKCVKITRDKKNLKLGKVNPLTLNSKLNSKWNPCSNEKIMVSELRAPWPQWCKIQIATSCARAAYQTSFQTCINIWLDTSWHILTLWILSNMALWVVVLLRFILGLGVLHSQLPKLLKPHSRNMHFFSFKHTGNHEPKWLSSSIDVKPVPMGLESDRNDRRLDALTTWSRVSCKESTHGIQGIN